MARGRRGRRGGAPARRRLRALPPAKRRRAPGAQARAGRRGLRPSAHSERRRRSRPAASASSITRRTGSSCASSPELQARELPQTEGALYASWSPDGRSVAYVERGRLWTVAVDGGQPSEVGAVPADLAGSGGTAWSEDGLIVAAGSDKVGLFAIPAKGGEGRDLAPLDRSTGSRLPRGERAARRPRLPVHRASAGGARHDQRARERDAARAAAASRGEPALACLFLDRPHPVPPRVHQPRSLGDRLLARHAGGLGRAVSVLPGGSAPSVATDGTLALVRASETPSELVWVGRDGAVEKAADLPGPANDDADARRARAVRGRAARGRQRAAGGLRRPLGVRSREGLDLAPDVDAVRCAGLRLDTRRPRDLRLAARRTRWNLWRATTDGGVARAAVEFDGIQNPLAVSPDGRFLAYAQGAGASRRPLRAPARRHGRGHGPFSRRPPRTRSTRASRPTGASSRTSRTRPAVGGLRAAVPPRAKGAGRCRRKAARRPPGRGRAPEILFRSRDRIMAARLTLRGRARGRQAAIALRRRPRDLSHAFSVAPDGRAC